MATHRKDKEPTVQRLLRTFPSLLVLTVVALSACNVPGRDPRPPDVAYAMRWWNVLSPEQMVAALYGTMATEEQAAAAKKRYAELDPETKKKVNDAAYAINGADEHESVGAWWETLDCRLMRIAAGDGNEADPMSAFCAHYPGSGHETILDDEALEHVNEVGMALLGRTTPGGAYLAPPEWLHGTYETCLLPDVFGGWEFSKHDGHPNNVDLGNGCYRVWHGPHGSGP